MEVLPALLLLKCVVHIKVVVLFRVSRKILVQHPVQDQHYKPDQQDHKHSGVDDREPVDFDRFGKEGAVLGVSLRELSSRLLPRR